MTFTWEAVTAVSTALTTIILLLTVVMGKRQLDLLRKSTQLDGLIAVLRQLDAPRYVESRRFVLHDLADCMKDETFRRQIADGGVDETIHREMPTLAIFEELGAYVRYELVDAEAIYCMAGARAIRCWEKLHDVVELQRRRGGVGIWDNFERLCEQSLRYFRRMNPNFPDPPEEPPAGA